MESFFLFHFYLVVSGLVLAMGIAIAARVTQAWLIPQAARASSLGAFGLLEFANAAGITAAIFCTALFLQPTGIGLFVGIVLVTVCLITWFRERQQRREAFLSVITSVLAAGGSQADAAESFGKQQRGALAVRASTFSLLCRKGIAPVRAATIAGLPWPVQFEPAFFTPPAPIASSSALDDDESTTPLEDAEGKLILFLWAIAGFTLFITLLLLFFTEFLLPTLVEIDEEMQVELTGAAGSLTDILTNLPRYLALLCIAAFCMLGIRGLLALFSLSAIRYHLPLFGRINKVRLQADGLRFLASQIKAGRSVAAIATMLPNLADPDLKRAIDRFVDSSQRGEGVAAGLLEARLIRRADMPWIESAQHTNRLPAVMVETAARLEREQARRTSTIVSAGSPALLILVSLPVALAGYVLFSSLTVLIHVSAEVQ